MNPNVTLANLNELRHLAGMKPLKAWKESKAKLAAAIDKLSANVIGTDIRIVPRDNVVPIADQSMPEDVLNAIDAFASDVVNKVPAKAAVKKLEKAIEEKNGAHVTLVQIATELGWNPKVARAKARRIKMPAGAEVSKHTYARSHKDAVIAALKKDHRKK